MKYSLDAAILLTALSLVMFFLPTLPGVVKSNGMKSLNILAGIEAALLGVILPAVDGLLIRQSVISKQMLT